MTKQKKVTKSDAIQELWNRGELKYKLKGKQVDLYEAFKQANDDINVICCSRRFGKSYILFMLAVETCLKKEDAVVKYACPTQKQVKEIVRKIGRTLLEDCPAHLKPEWKEADKLFVFPNGSEIQIAATDNGNIENIRGGAADLCIVDEAGFCTDLVYAVDNVLAPTTDTTDGKVILASTPNPKDPTHEFNMEYVLPRQEAGTLVKFTIYDSPMISDERRQKIIDRYGIENPRFRCEYLCEVAVDPERLVIGEFTPEKEAEMVKEVDVPEFYDSYVAMDIGFKDLTGILFAYYDYLKGQLVIVDEFVTKGSGVTTDKLAEIVKEYENKHFMDKNGLLIEPTRISDNNNPILLQDLLMLHQMQFMPTKKDNKDAQINEVKMRIKQNKIVIHPRCINLIYHLKSAKWNKKRNGFERVRDNKEAGLLGGHVDLLDALIYLVRNVSLLKNPYPDGYFDMRGGNIFYRTDGNKVKKSVESFMKGIMGIKDDD